MISWSNYTQDQDFFLVTIGSERRSPVIHRVAIPFPEEGHSIFALLFSFKRSTDD